MLKLPGHKEAMLNGIPLSEVQRREKRGQIVNYPGQRWIGRPPVGDRTANQVTVEAFKSAPRANGAGADMKQFKTSDQRAPVDMGGRPSGGGGMALWQRYRAAIDGQLAGMSWMKGSSLNIGIVLVLGLGVALPVKLFFGFFALMLGAFPEVSAVISTSGTIAALGATAYFALRKLTGKLDS